MFPQCLENCLRYVLTHVNTIHENFGFFNNYWVNMSNACTNKKENISCWLAGLCVDDATVVKLGGCLLESASTTRFKVYGLRKISACMAVIG